MTFLTSSDMYDAIYPANIPSNAAYVAGYVDGAWPWMRTQPNLFPSAHKFTFCVFPTTRAQCLDVEHGDASPAQAPGWVLDERSIGKDPWVYCSLLGDYGWQAVQNAFNNAKVAHPHYFIAAYNGTRALPVLNGITAIAHQYVDVGPYDLSSLSDTAVAIIGGGNLILDEASIQEVSDRIMKALQTYRPLNNRSIYDLGNQAVDTGFQNQATLKAITGALSANEAALLAAIKTQTSSGSIDVASFATSVAAALVPMLPKDTDPATLAAIGSAVTSALKDQMNKA